MKEKGSIIDIELLKILACPVCKADVKLKKNKLICVKCKEEYPIEDGIPIMLPKELRKQY
ncbi:MAG: Trm112 family protein [Candidatus Parvarchaeota archaeon]|nr:Trm112 family protein [Candidatus Jingweiarchaeum tengchongense]MCW1297775.1 Trm112 family protein [Candidatus Jingweiarchaeum tengchongense]MCW1299785.1 Trm112 family protein [Candidatus Jingweiarchaeum tengchongense]MCW1304244.1 Trm112 family protein [Candidatus Jingweiarchaeum tengchongense]MCW1305272.1 Trm112 family protein [Candidatus Jingweiarchaeum tengchongense]